MTGGLWQHSGTETRSASRPSSTLLLLSPASHHPLWRTKRQYDDSLVHVLIVAAARNTTHGSRLEVTRSKSHADNRYKYVPTDDSLGALHRLHIYFSINRTALTKTDIYHGFRLVVFHQRYHLTVHVGGSGLLRAHQGQELPEETSSFQFYCWMI